jgi:hypothetical protein
MDHSILLSLVNLQALRQGATNVVAQRVVWAASNYFPRNHCGRGFGVPAGRPILATRDNGYAGGGMYRMGRDWKDIEER